MASTDRYDETLKLAFQLQMEELEALKAGQRGKNRAGEPTDLDVAIDTFKREIEASNLFSRDRKLCQSIAQAVRLDGAAILAHQREERRAAHDRRVAQGINNGRHPITNTEPGKVVIAASDVLLAQLEAMNLSPQPTKGPSDEAESSAWAATRKHPLTAEDYPVDMRECAICRDETPSSSLVRRPCSHEYCAECLSTVFRNSLTTEAAFPPRCCSQPIPVEDARRLLSKELIGLFKAREVEMTTPNRTYCHQQTCSAFIPVQFIRHDVGTCVRCKAKTCVFCKGATHEKECPEDPERKAVLRIARENKWQSCSQCHAVIELKHGCNHISKWLTLF